MTFERISSIFLLGGLIALAILTGLETGHLKNRIESLERSNLLNLEVQEKSYNTMSRIIYQMIEKDWTRYSWNNEAQRWERWIINDDGLEELLVFDPQD